MLTKAGWITAILIATVFLLGGLGVYLLYPILFLILGSFVSKLNPTNEDNNARKAIQVLANGGVAFILALYYIVSPNNFIPLAIVISFSVALSDTFSSEIGKRFGGTPYDICTRKPIKNGLSGGISFIGSLAGLFGSFLIAVLYYLHQQNFRFAIHTIIFGFIGMLIDSFIGSLFQAKYTSENIVSETGKRNNLSSGYSFIDNNITNFLSILITVLIYILVMQNL